MRQYIVKFYGGAVTVPLEREMHFMSDDFARKYVKSSLVAYYPVYYSGALWKIDEDGGTTIVAEYRSSVTVAENVP